MSEREVYLVRHGHDDHSHIDGYYNTSLTIRGIEDARQMGSRMAILLGDQENRVIDIYTSSKKRSVETAEILGEEFGKNRIEYGFHADERLKELYQGKIINIEKLSHQEKTSLLQIAWEAFDERRVGGNLNYHFGDFQPEGGVHKSLRGFIEYPYGESQGDFSYRVGDALRDTLMETRDAGSVPIIVTHRGGVREIRNLVYATNNDTPMRQYKECEMSGLKYCEIVRESVHDVSFSILALSNYLKTLKDNDG